MIVSHFKVLPAAFSLSFPLKESVCRLRYVRYPSRLRGWPGHLAVIEKQSGKECLLPTALMYIN